MNWGTFIKTQTLSSKLQIDHRPDYLSVNCFRGLLTFKHSGGPASLHLSQRVDSPKALNKAHHCQCGLGKPRREQMLVKTQPVTTLSLQS